MRKEVFEMDGEMFVTVCELKELFCERVELICTFVND